MIKSELIAAVAEKSGESKAAAARVVEAFQDVVIEQVSKGEEIKLTGFFAASSYERPARTMKNPRTQEEIKVPASKAIRLRPLKRFRDEVKNG